MTNRTLSKPHSERVTPLGRGRPKTANETLQDRASGYPIQDAIDYRARDSANSTIEKYRRHLKDYKVWLESEGSPTDMRMLQGTSGYQLLKALPDLSPR
jgi:hypothetical protein